VITAVLGAPGSGKSTVAQPLAARLPAHVVLDWDAFMDASAALAGREISRNPDTWPAYRQLVRAVLDTMKHLPVVLLGVCTPTELAGWPVDAWVVLDCTDQERRLRLRRRSAPDDVREAIRDASEYRALGLPVIDTTGQPPDKVAADLADLVQRLEQPAREA
jgi:broad-specificity NMP kinase